MRPLEKSLPLKLLMAREAVMDRFRPHLHAHDITEQQWRVLRALAEFGDIDVGTLSTRIAILMPSLSRMLPDMEDRGLVRRRKHATDARTVIVSLAPKGRTLFDAMSAHSEVIYREFERAVGRHALNALMASLNHLIATIDTLPKADIEPRRRATSTART